MVETRKSNVGRMDISLRLKEATRTNRLARIARAAISG